MCVGVCLDTAVTFLYKGLLNAPISVSSCFRNYKLFTVKRQLNLLAHEVCFTCSLLNIDFKLAC